MRWIQDKLRTRNLLGMAALLLLPGLMAPAVPLGCLFASDCSNLPCCSGSPAPQTADVAVQSAWSCCCEQMVISEANPVADRESVKVQSPVKPVMTVAYMQPVNFQTSVVRTGITAGDVPSNTSLQLHRTVVLLL